MRRRGPVENEVRKDVKTVCLQGEPGTGKSCMACLTALRKPVTVIDVDRKIKSAGWAQKAIEKQELFVWELSEPVDESNVRARIGQLVKNEKPSMMPKGWTLFTELFYDLAKKEEAKASG